MIRAFKTVAAILAILLGTLATVPAQAHGPHHRGRVHLGIFIGAPVVWYHYRPYYYYYPYYPPVIVAPPPVVVAPSPPVYIERGDPPPAPDSAQSYWYYCRESKAYYPYVKECPGGWQRVLPHSPNT
jgi:hypothetical protein